MSKKDDESKRLALLREIAESGIGLEDEDEALRLTKKETKKSSPAFIKLDEDNNVIIDPYAVYPARRWSASACPKCFKGFVISVAIRGRMRHGDTPEIKCKKCGHRFNIVLYQPAIHNKNHTEIPIPNA